MIELIRPLDAQLLSAIQGIVLPWAIPLALAVTFVGNPSLWIIIAVLLHWFGWDDESFYLMNVVLFSSVAAGIVKFAVAAPRPSAEKFTVIAKDFYTGWSFPSGHSTLIAAVWAYLHKYLGKIAGFVLLLAVPLVALSRLVLGVHFPSDVVAGIILGLGVGYALLWLRQKVRHSHFKPSKVMDSLAIAGILIAGLLVLVFLQNIPLVAVLLGYYVGFFLLKEIGFEQKKEELATGLWKVAAGCIGTGLVLLPIVLFSGFGVIALHSETTAAAFVSFGAAGFWASFGLPWLWKKLIMKKEQ
mgnify:CR=1 FL=1